MYWHLRRHSIAIGKPAPCVSAFVDAVAEAIRVQSPSHGMSTLQRAWLVFCVTAVLVPTSIGWARLERASLGSSALAALSWMFRHSKIPWDALLVASGRGMLPIDVVEHLVSSDAPQEQLHRCTHALDQVLACGRSKQHMIQRQLGRLGPTTSLKYRADAVMRHMPALSS